MVPSQVPAAQPLVGTGTIAYNASRRDPFWMAFWEAYPRKERKRDAWNAWWRARKRGADMVLMIEGAKRYARDPNRDPQYTAHAATWLNGDRWEDPPLPKREARRRGAAATTMDALATVLAECGPDGNLPIEATGRQRAIGGGQ